jgi:hypothetical protein
MTEVSIPLISNPENKSDPEIPIIDDQMLAQIEKIYEKYEALPVKPLLTGGYCEDIARDLEELGLKYQKGFFKTDDLPGLKLDTSYIDHDWAQDGESTIVALDGQQFNKYLSKDLFEPGVVLVKRGDPRYIRFVPKVTLTERVSRKLNSLKLWGKRN